MQRGRHATFTAILLTVILGGLTACGHSAPGHGPARLHSTALAPTGRSSLAVSSPRPADVGGAVVEDTAGDTATGASAPPAQTGRSAGTQRITFVPQRITLSGRGPTATAPIVVTDTGPSGMLAIPRNPATVGWWKSGALAGEEFGSVVLAGHIDSADYGLGFFARLLTTRRGDTVVLSDGTHRQTYRVASVRDVSKNVLASGTDTFSQRGPARLVLLTCTGKFVRATGHYDHNLVVVADPVAAPPGATASRDP